jgi:hypothetical protein
MKEKIKIILIHGNYGGTREDNWQPYLEKNLKEKGFNVINETFPDNELARESIWIPHLEKLGADENTVVVGHSSGAIAAMKYAEDHKLLGSVLVGGYYTDLDDENEKKSGYFQEEWDWEKIKNNQKWIVQFSSTDDPYIPKEESRHVAKMLETEYFEYTDKGHFGSESQDMPEFPELMEALLNKLER